MVQILYIQANGTGEQTNYLSEIIETYRYIFLYTMYKVLTFLRKEASLVVFVAVLITCITC